MNQVIVTAILNRRVLSLEYDGSVRLVEPHTYGVNSAGQEALSCYQVADKGKPTAAPNWRFMLIPKASAIAMSDTTFPRARANYVRNTQTMTRIYAQL